MRQLKGEVGQGGWGDDSKGGLKTLIWQAELPPWLRNGNETQPSDFKNAVSVFGHVTGFYCRSDCSVE